MDPKIITIGRLQMLGFLVKYAPNIIKKVYCDKDHEAAVHKLFPSFERHACSIRIVERHQLDGLLDRDEKGGHGGVVIQCQAPEGMELDTLTHIPVLGTQVIVVLDEIQDVHNLGAIARSALLFGAQGIVFSENRTASITPAAIRSSAGTLLLGRFSVIRNVTRALEDLKRKNYWICGLDVEFGQSEKEIVTLERLGEYERLAMVVGGEHRGIRPLVRAHCNFVTSIPLVPAYQDISLNVSVALAVALASLGLSSHKYS